jgi:Xaa-Pro aminopeptidase
VRSFTGSAGTAIITRNNAYMLTDSRYWIQAQDEMDHNWTLIRVGTQGQPQDWIEWLMVYCVYLFSHYMSTHHFLQERVRNSRIGIDARMISHEKATLINSKINTHAIDSKLVYPPQNLVDLIWIEKPTKSLEMVYIQSTEFAGMLYHSLYLELYS